MMRPVSGKMTPERQSPHVVLPAPRGPTRARICPSSAVKDTASRATRGPKRFVSPTTSRIRIRRRFGEPRGSARGRVPLPEARLGLDVLDDVDPHARGIEEAEAPLPEGLVAQGIAHRGAVSHQAFMLGRRVLDLELEA